MNVLSAVAAPRTSGAWTHNAADLGFMGASHGLQQHHGYDAKPGSSHTSAQLSSSGLYPSSGSHTSAQLSSSGLYPISSSHTSAQVSSSWLYPISSSHTSAQLSSSGMWPHPIPPIPPNPPGPGPHHDAIVPPPPYIPYNVVGPVNNQCDFATPFFCSTLPPNGGVHVLGGESTLSIPPPLVPGDIFQWFNSGPITPHMMEAGYNFSNNYKQ